MKSIIFVIIISILSLSNPVSADKSNVIEVVVEGIGASPEAATKNAVEQALMQAVGTFVDTTTLVKQRSKIQNEVRSITRSIDTSTREFSQGVIDQFNQLDIRNDGGIYRVSAVVIVHSKKLVPLFGDFVVKEKKINSNLLSQFEVETKQEGDRQFLIARDVLAPLYNWSAYDIRMADLLMVREPMSDNVVSQLKTQIDVSNQINSNALQMILYRHGFSDRQYKNRFTLMLPYSMQLKAEYLHNVTKIMENTADEIGRNQRDCRRNEKHLVINLISNTGDKCFIYKNILSDFWRRDDVRTLTRTPTIAVQLKSQEGVTVHEALSEHTSHQGKGAIHTNCLDPYSCNAKLVFHDIHAPRFDDTERLGGWQLHYLPKPARFWIFNEQEGLVLLGMDNELAKRASSISFGPH